MTEEQLNLLDRAASIELDQMKLDGWKYQLAVTPRDACVLVIALRLAIREGKMMAHNRDFVERLAMHIEFLLSKESDAVRQLLTYTGGGRP